MLVTMTQSFRWLKAISDVAALQAASQIIGALSGFILVRSLSAHEYALFAIALSMIALMSGLSDAGLQSGFLSRGGTLYADRPSLERLAADTIALRLRLAACGLLVVLPTTAYLLSKQGAPASLTALVCLLVVVGSIPAAHIGVLASAMRLTGNYLAAQWNEALSALVRLGAALIIALAAPISIVAIGASIGASWLQYRQLSHQFNLHVVRESPPDDGNVAHLKSAVRQLWFPTWFSAFQSQIAIWILGFAGTRTDIADFGALSRFAFFFALVHAVITSIAAPTFARTSSLKDMRNAGISTIALLSLICGALIATAYLLPGPFVWVLGPTYAHLTASVGPYFILGSLNALAALLWAMLSAKMWVGLAWTIPLLTLVLQVILAGILDASTVAGVLRFTILSATVPVLVELIMLVKGIRAVERTEVLAERPPS